MASLHKISRGDPPFSMALLAKCIVTEIMQDMRLMGGDPPSDNVRRAYVSRLVGLLNHGALQVLDQPHQFPSVMKIHERPPSSNLSFLKAVMQFIQTLTRKGRWYEFFKADAEPAADAYRRLIRLMNAQLKTKAQALC